MIERFSTLVDSRSGVIGETFVTISSRDPTPGGLQAINPSPFPPTFVGVRHALALPPPLLSLTDKHRTAREAHNRLSPASCPTSVLVYFLYLMDFEFDPAKSAANLKKHGIDFIGAQALWSDPDRLEVAARSLDEPRTQVIGRIDDVVWSAFVTMRGDRTRIISVRRARDEEKTAYLQD